MMKMTVLSSAILLALLLAAGTSAVAQYGGEQYRDEPRTTVISPATELLTTEGIFGKAVRNPQGQELGRIESLIMDIETNQIGYAVLSPRDVPGMGRENLLVPWSALRLGPTADTFFLDLSPEQLQRAPKGQTITSRSQEMEIHRYYGVAPYWGGPSRQTQPTLVPEEPSLIEQPEPSLREPSVREPSRVPNGY